MTKYTPPSHDFSATRLADLRNIISRRDDLSAAEAETLNDMLDAAARLRIHFEQIGNSVRAHLDHIDRHKSHADQVQQITAHAKEHGDASAADTFGIRETDARGYRLMQMRKERMVARQRRNLTIMRLAGRGWTNKAIARHVHLHPCTISRIIQRELSARPAQRKTAAQGDR